MLQNYQDEIINKTMEILTDKQIAQLYDKIVQNPRFIPTLSEQQSIELTHHAEKILSYWDKIFKAVAESDDSNPVMQEARYLKYTTESPNYQTAKALLLALDIYKNPPQPDKKVSIDTPVKKKKNNIYEIWCYAYYHLILEKIDETKTLPMYTRKEVARISNKLYKIDGNQFYEQYYPLCKVPLVKSIREMNPKRREKLKNAIIKLADIYNSPQHLIWWNRSIL